MLAKVERQQVLTENAVPVLLCAVKENAAEKCTTYCLEEVDSQAAKAPADKPMSDKDKKDKYNGCYTKCVSEETRDVTSERLDVSPTRCITCLNSSNRVVGLTAAQ